MSDQAGKDEKEKQTQESDGAVGGEAASDKAESTDTKLNEDLSTTEWLMKKLKLQFGLTSAEELPEKLLPDLSFDGVVEYIKSGKCKNIITMAGAGISTSAGIPDFRTPGAGLYDNLKKYNLPNPQAIFTIDFFMENPEPFFQLAKELWPGVFKPTPCHYFIKLLNDKGLLLRHYTQNIDTLEREAGLPDEKIVEAHGTFHTSHCLQCKTEYTQKWMKEEVMADKIPKCTKEGCEGVVKPDIVFFGEALPPLFQTRVFEDMPKCDMLIVMGTSLVVHPFSSLTNRVPDECPRLYINLERAEGSNDPIMALLGAGHGFKFDEEDNYRDVFWQGTCDNGCHKLADKLGWGDELKKIVQDEHNRIDEENSKSSPSKGADGAGSSKQASKGGKL